MNFLVFALFEFGFKTSSTSVAGFRKVTKTDFYIIRAMKVSTVFYADFVESNHQTS